MRSLDYDILPEKREPEKPRISIKYVREKIRGLHGLLSGQQPDHPAHVGATYLLSLLSKENLGIPYDQAVKVADALRRRRPTPGATLDEIAGHIAGCFPRRPVEVDGMLITSEPINLHTISESPPDDLPDADRINAYIRECTRYRLLSPREETYFGMMKDAWMEREAGRADESQRGISPTQRDPDLLDKPIILSLSCLHPEGKEYSEEDLLKANSMGQSLNKAAIVKIRYKSQKAAIDTFVNHNLRLVVAYVMKRKKQLGMHTMDMINEGNIGLMHAAYHFDHRMGNRFSTYAMWWIRQAVLRAIYDQNRTIRIPVHVNETLSKVRKFKKEFKARVARTPTTSEIAAALGLKEQILTKLLFMAEKDPISLETKVEESAELQDFVKSEDNRFDYLGLRAAVDQALDTLCMDKYDPKKVTLRGRVMKVALCLHYGLIDYLTPKDIEGIAEPAHLRRSGIYIKGTEGSCAHRDGQADNAPPGKA